MNLFWIAFCFQVINTKLKNATCIIIIQFFLYKLIKETHEHFFFFLNLLNFPECGIPSVNDPINGF